MNITRHPEHTVNWIDLGTPGMGTAAFCTTLFGRTVAPPDSNGYRLCRLRGHLVAALGPAEDAGAPNWTTNVTVSDVQATATRFTNLGAQIIVAPTQVGTLGHTAATEVRQNSNGDVVMRDPTGALFGLAQHVR